MYDVCPSNLTVPDMMALILGYYWRLRIVWLFFVKYFSYSLYILSIRP